MQHFLRCCITLCAAYHCVLLDCIFRSGLHRGETPGVYPGGCQSEQGETEGYQLAEGALRSRLGKKVSRCPATLGRTMH